MSRLAVCLMPLILAASPAVALVQDPHAGHRSPARPAVQDPHAGHARPPTRPPARPRARPPVRPPAATPPPVHPHAGHRPTAEQPVQDPHAGHDMSTVPPPVTPPAPAAADPHAGHDMSAMPPVPGPVDHHAGHDMSTMVMAAPDIPTSTDNSGRPAEAPVPAAALGGPVHAADTVFGTEAMAAARRTLVRENGDVRTTAVIIDRLEVASGNGDQTGLWDVQGWSGGDINRFWWKSEGEGTFGDGLHEAELQALYSRAATPFWDVQAGVRRDLRPDGEDATHLVLGVQGLAPYWWEIDAAAFLSTDGDLTARIEAEYDQRITQRWILQPRIEVEASASDNPALEIGSGVTSVEAGLRLRYEFRNEFAPYVGVEWSRAFGETADYIEAAGGETEATRLVIGLKAWF